MVKTKSTKVKNGFMFSCFRKNKYKIRFKTEVIQILEIRFCFDLKDTLKEDLILKSV